MLTFEFALMINYTALLLRLNLFRRGQTRIHHIDIKRIIIEHNMFNTNRTIVTPYRLGNIVAARLCPIIMRGNRESFVFWRLYQGNKYSHTCQPLCLWQEIFLLRSRARTISINAVENLWSNFRAIVLFALFCSGSDISARSLLQLSARINLPDTFSTAIGGIASCFLRVKWNEDIDSSLRSTTDGGCHLLPVNYSIQDH